MIETTKLVEVGLGATRTKVGYGDKEEGYEIRASKLKAFLLGVMATIVVLAIAVGVCASVLPVSFAHRTACSSGPPHPPPTQPLQGH